MTWLPDPVYFSTMTLVGWGWSLPAYWLMFSARGKALLSNPWCIIVAFACLALSLWHVGSEMARLIALAGGIMPLDGQYNYGVPQVVEFAEALGAEGRREYIIFQLGADALAPPAFVCFLMAVYRSTIRSATVQRIITSVAFAYFTSVLIANAYMPVIMDHYPDSQTGSLPLLYGLIPLMDWVKYTAHAIAWIIIVAGWAWQIGNQSRKSKASKELHT
ncbi:MAG: hypothetical protein AAF559_05645 [Pseudomonadota bacterium]